MRKTASVTLLLIIVSLYSQSFCAIISKNVTLKDILTKHHNYGLLDEKEVSLLNRIINKIGYSEDPVYYTEYLLVLLNTPYNKDKSRLKRQQRESLNRSVKSNKPKPSSHEEDKSNTSKYTWVNHYPKGKDYFYYVNRDNPLDLRIVVTIRIDADEETKQSILLLEDLIEKHMAVPGFSVDIQWSNDIDEGIIGVKADQGEWATSHNWAGDHFTIAHELFHIFGLDDEYDRIESHADNQYITYETRLHWFLYQMDAYMYADAEEGIMVHNTKKALPRHVCWAVGLGDECIAARTIRYGSLHEIK